MIIYLLRTDKFLKVINSKRFFIGLLIFLFLAFSLVGIKKFINIDTSLYDFGIQHQVIANTANEHWFESSIEVDNFLGDHTAFLMAIPALIYKIVPTPFVLFVVQSGAVILGAYGIYLIALEILQREKLAKLISLIFVFYIPLSANLLFDFHENSLGIPFLIFGMYYFIKGKALLSYFLMFMALLAKEDFGFFIGGFGLYHLLIQRNLKAIPLLFGYLYSVYAMFVLIPLYRAGELSDSFLRFSRFGTTGGEVISNIVKDPLGAIKHMFSGYKIFYIFKLAYPLVFLSFIAPASFLVFLPNLVINLLSDNGSYNSGLYHYNVLISVGIFYSAIIGLKNIQDNKILSQLKNLTNQISIQFAILSLVLINSSIILFHPVWKDVIKPLDRFDEYQYIQNFKNEISDLSPTSSTVGVANTLGSLFGEFRNLQIVYPLGWGTYSEIPDYVVLDKEYGSEVVNIIESYVKSGYKIYDEYKLVVILKNSVE